MRRGVETLAVAFGPLVPVPVFRTKGSEVRSHPLPHGRATLKAHPTLHHPPSPLQTNLTFIFVDVAHRDQACQMMATTRAARATDPTAKRIPAKRSQNILRFVIFSSSFASILTL
jgi:hypothetical protein